MSPTKCTFSNGSFLDSLSINWVKVSELNPSLDAWRVVPLDTICAPREFRWPVMYANCKNWCEVVAIAPSRGNEHVDRQAPWTLAKHPARRTELESTLATLVRQLARQAVYLWPFMPGKSEELWKSLGAPGSPGEVRFKGLERLDPTGWKVEKGASLFPKKDSQPE